MADILQWNIRGIKGNFPELKLLFGKYNPKVVCIQETKLPLNENFQIKGYKPYHHWHTDNQIACGGTTIYVSNKTPQDKVPLVTPFQAVAVRVTLNKPLTVCSLYVPERTLSLRDLEDLILQLPKPFILLGDFNAHSPLWGNLSGDPKGKIVEDLLGKNQICLFNDESPTYINPHTLKPSSIDLTLCDPSIFTDFSWSVEDDLHGSDHFPIVLHPAVPSKSTQEERWNFKKADWPAFTSECTVHLSTMSPDTTYQTFYDTLLSICEKTIPKTTSKPRKNVLWFTEDCRKLVIAKRTARKKFQRTGKPEHRTAYKMLCAKVRRTIREKKRLSFQKYVSKINNRTPMNKIWKIIKKLKGTSGDAVHHIHNPNGTTAETNTDIANSIADTLEHNSSTEHYTDTFKKNKARSERNTINFSSLNDEKYNTPFSVEELKTCISETSLTAPGPDKIHNEILKHLPEDTLEILLNIFNNIWTSQCFPESWRSATIIPIPKPGKDHTNPSNYRPIALTSCLCKLMEKLVHKRLMWYLEHNSSLSEFQSGFRKNRSLLVDC